MDLDIFTTSPLIIGVYEFLSRVKKTKRSLSIIRVILNKIVIILQFIIHIIEQFDIVMDKLVPDKIHDTKDDK